MAFHYTSLTMFAFPSQIKQTVRPYQPIKRGSTNHVHAKKVVRMSYKKMSCAKYLCLKKSPSIVFSQASSITPPPLQGLTLVEILGVLIKNIDRENPGDLYGTVSITDCFGTVNLFNRDRSHIQSVGPGDWADIAWPSRAISAANDFAIDVNLMDRDTFPDLSPDDEVARGRLLWNSRGALRNEYNTAQKKEVNGKCGSVEVHYVVLTDAVVATVKVVVVDGDGENDPDVYGTITAETRTASGETLQYKLFDIKRGEDHGVPINTAIPLQRSVISAALCSELQVHANLWDADRDLSPDDQIALGSVNFRPRLAGVDCAEIKGEYGRVRVEVTWSV